MQRRRRVMRALVAVERAVPSEMGMRILAFHVVYFGLPECTRDLTVERVRDDLRWLRGRGFVDGGGRHDVVSTEEGRAWAEEAA
jgi:hypothetical protein